MPTTTHSVLDEVAARLNEIDGGLQILTSLMSEQPPPVNESEPLERDVPPWIHLVQRRHPWRRQLYVRGRNMTARILVGRMYANGWTVEETATDAELGPDVVREAIRYVDANPVLIRLETLFERLQHRPRGALANGARSLPR